MAGSILQRIPVVGTLAYVERLRPVQSAFTATLVAEPDNRYFRHAIAVLASGDKVGYVAPEVAGHYYEAIKTAAAPITCAARRATTADHDTSGVELLLDFTRLAPLCAE